MSIRYGFTSSGFTILNEETRTAFHAFKSSPDWRIAHKLHLVWSKTCPAELRDQRMLDRFVLDKCRTNNTTTSDEIREGLYQRCEEQLNKEGKFVLVVKDSAIIEAAERE